ncbi:MAG: bacteriohemerythrin [Chloroflexota bacterium]
MTTIIWDPEKMSTGVPGVDAQHQEWIRRYNSFCDAITQGKGMEEVKRTLNFFIEYADTHFNYEEKVMAERHCRTAEANRAAHENMRQILAGFNGYVAQHGYSIMEMQGLRLQMEKWLINHILNIDLGLRETAGMSFDGVATSPGVQGDSSKASILRMLLRLFKK